VRSLVLQIDDAEKCEDVSEVTRKKKVADSRITFIKVADAPLDAKVLKSLGKSVRSSLRSRIRRKTLC
jgi:hypothetical protein